MAESKRSFYLVDQDGHPAVGHVGLEGGVPGADEGPDVKVAGTPIVTNNPGWISQLENHPNITETPPKGKN